MPVTNTTFVRATAMLLLLGLVTLLAITGTSLWLASRTSTFTETVLSMQRIRQEVFRVISFVQDAETGQRGYLLTRDPAYLAPYVAAKANMQTEIDGLRHEVGESGEFRPAVNHLAELIDLKMDELQDTIDLVQADRQAEAMAIVRSDRGKVAMDAVRQVSADLVDTLNARIRTAAAETRQSGVALTWVLILGGALIVVVVGGSTWIAWRYTHDLQAARAEVLGLNVSLEERVRERTADVFRANEEIQRFAYIVSHDLRSPLVNIMGFTSELEAGLASIRSRFGAAGENGDPATAEARLAIDAEMPEAIGFIRSSTSKMDNLINAILRLSREGRRSLSAKPVDMASVVNAAADSVRHRLQESEGKILVEQPMPDIVSDRVALEQIFGNLIDNAVKYLDPARSGRIVVRGREAPGRVEYEIEDNGRGIAAGDHERIFDLFRRAGRQDTPGEGIGLSHVRALVRRLGGEISLESELGRGTTFRVRLPKMLTLREEAA